MNNSEKNYNAKFGTAVLDKTILNGDGKALSSDNESDIKTLSDIYKSTKFIVGYWDEENGKPVISRRVTSLQKKLFQAILTTLTALMERPTPQVTAVTMCQQN